MAERPIFAIFEGGGAKGVAHIGAVAACEQNGFYFTGVAGASAGAIIAALIAAGFSADEIFDPDESKKNLLARYNETPISLVGRGPWNRAQNLAAQAKAAASAKGFWRRQWARLQLYRRRQELGDALKAGGYFDTQYGRRVLNRILAEQVAAVRAANGLTGPHPQTVRFEDLDPAICPEFRPLKIISANVDTQELAIFDLASARHLEVALAVAASVAIPGVFQPVLIPNEAGRVERYMDGGAVANLPVWVFANDKLAYERAFPDGDPVPIVGFTLKPPLEPASAATDPPPEWLDYIGKGLTTALAGSQSVIQDFLDDLVVAPLHTSLGTLQFDADLGTMVEAYKAGRRCADRDLKHFLIDFPALVREELAEFHEAVRKGLLARLPPPQRRRRILLRAAIVQHVARDDFRVTFGHNMAANPDDRLRLDVRGRGAALAFTGKDAVFAPVGPSWSQPHSDFMTKYERGLVNPKIRAIIAAPIFPDASAWAEPNPANRPDPCGVVAIDSDRDRELAAAFDDDQFMSLLKAQSTLLYAALKTEPTRG